MSVLVFHLSSIAQSITVYDNTSLRPLHKVAVKQSGVTDVFLSNESGLVQLQNLNPSDTLKFSLVGYTDLVLMGSQIIENSFSVGMTEKAFDLNEVIISSSRFEEKRGDVPFQVQVINEKELKYMNQQTSADVLQQSGNVMVQKSQQGGGSPILRGFEASRVLIVIDGVRMNNAIYRAGHLQNVITIDNNMLEKVEVVFGPSSTVYGSDALGGVMHFHTRQAKLSDKNGSVNANAFTRYSTANHEKTGHIDFNLGWKKFASLTSFTYSDFGDLRMGNNRNNAYGDWGKRLWYVERQNGVDVMVQNDDPNIQVGSAYKQWDLLQKFLYKQNDKVSHQLNFQYSSSSDVPRYDRLTQMSGTSPKFAEWYYGPQKRILAAYSLNLTNDKGIYDNARIGLSYQNIEESRVSRRFSGSSSKYRDSQIENLNVIALNADFSKQIKKNELRYGVEGLFNTVDSKGIRYDINADTTGKVASRYPDGGSTYQAMAVYLSHTYEASEELIIVDGIRYTNVNLKSKFIDTTFFPFPYNSYTQNNGALTGSLGVIFKPGKDWRINLTGSSAFRAPNVDDLSKVFESTNGNLIVPNPEIKPEFTYNLDLGIQKTFNKTITASLIGYYTWYQNLITTVPGTFNGQDSVLFNGTLSAVNTMDNASNAYLYGGSANLNADINEHFSITSSINYTYGRIKTDTTDYPLDHIAPVFGKTSFVLKMKRFRSEFFVMYSGWKSIKDYNMIGEDNFAFATPYGMPAWATLNLRSSFTVTKNLMLQASLENITDLHYRTFGSNFSAPGRNLVITLRGSF